MISNRLKSLVKYVNKKDLVADIGCDHGLLSIYLIKNKKCKSIIATDINSNALNNAIRNVEKNKLTNSIKTKVGNGLIPIIEENINTLIISGMGSATICHMFNNIEKKYKIITQSNNNYYELRKYFNKKGYIIKNEEIVFDNNKYYINIIFIEGNKKYTKKELIYGPLLINNKINLEYFKSILKKNRIIYKGIPFKNIKDKYRLYIRIRYLNKVINDLVN